MKMIFIFLLLFSVSTDPFATKADKPDNPDNDPDIALASSFLNNVIIPNKEDVGIVPYTDVKIFMAPTTFGLVTKIQL